MKENKSISITALCIILWITIWMAAFSVRLGVNNHIDHVCPAPAAETVTP